MSALPPYVVRFSADRRRTVPRSNFKPETVLSKAELRILKHLPPAECAAEQWEQAIGAVVNHFNGLDPDKDESVSVRVHSEYIGDSCQPVVEIVMAWTGYPTVTDVHDCVESLLAGSQGDVTLVYQRSPSADELNSIVAEIAAQLDGDQPNPKRTRSSCLALLRDDGFRLRAFEWLERGGETAYEATMPPFPQVPTGGPVVRQTYLPSTGLRVG